MVNENIQYFIENAIKEDIGQGDHSTLACIPKNKKGKYRLLIKEAGIIAGVEVAKQVFNQIDKNIKITIHLPDGKRVSEGDAAFIAEGKIHSLLKSERLVLNILQRMSGIATQTAQYVKRLEGLKTQVLDTRKTTPGLRYLEKMAVKLGGGENHRMGLYDMIMLKDNHIDFAGGIEQAVRKTHKYLRKKDKILPIEIEARSIEEVEEILKVEGIDRIMLDNFSVDDTKRAVEMINGKFETESSGGINMETIRDYAECGVDFISVGALTHQIKSLDMSLKAIDF
ncbi:MAG: carboxylating nicotinate-nucleotide diphosphorylase [Bacteroidota bacterium]